MVFNKASSTFVDSRRDEQRVVQPPLANIESVFNTQSETIYGVFPTIVEDALSETQALSLFLGLYY
jgi:hypothetical protein